MIVSLFFLLICFACSSSSASTRWRRSASADASRGVSGVSVVAVVDTSDHLPDHVSEAAVVERFSLEQLVAADLGPARYVGTRAGVGRQQLEEVARPGLLESSCERDERPGARLALGVDDARDDIHSFGTSKRSVRDEWCEMDASGALSRCQQGQAQMRSGIMAATVPISRVRIIAGATCYLRAAVRSNEEDGYGTGAGSTKQPAGRPRSASPCRSPGPKSVTSPPEGSISSAFDATWLSPMMWPSSCRTVGPWSPGSDHPGGLGSCALSTIQPLTNCRGSSGAVRGRATAANAWPFPENGMSVWPGDAQAMTTGAQRLP